jgi:hypothetical protein
MSQTDKWRHVVNIAPTTDAPIRAMLATIHCTMPEHWQGQITRPTGISLGRLPLAGKSVLVIEDEALIAMSVESCLQDAGAAVVIANCIALAKSVL